jgi:hypothetical protein
MRLGSELVRARIAILMLLMTAASCRKKNVPASGSDGGAVPVATLPPLPLEKFVAARASGSNIEVAAVARDRSVILTTLNAELQPIARDVLARDIEATEGTEISLVGDGLVVVVAKIGAPGAYLLRRGSAPLAMTRERCLTNDGVAWLIREGGNAKVRWVRATDVTSAPIAIPNESETHLSCGPESVVVSVRDGEHLSLTSMTFEQLSAPPAMVEIEKEKELDDELRDRVILPRRGNGVVILRIGESSISVREVGADAGAWRKVLKGTANASVHEDADLIEAAASPDPKGKVFFLVSEPTSGACGDGDPPRRIVLHEVNDVNDSTRPVIELPCGLEAIATHLHAEPARATMWWTEPVDGKTCAQAGMSASAIVTASSDKPGAKRAPILAEGVARADENRFVAVVRSGGCAPYAAAGNGAIVLAPTPR